MSSGDEWGDVNRSVGTRLLSRTLHYVDLFLMRLTDGRISVPGSLLGLPVVRLTTKGGRRGRSGPSRSWDSATARTGS